MKKRKFVDISKPFSKKSFYCSLFCFKRKFSSFFYFLKKKNKRKIFVSRFKIILIRDEIFYYLKSIIQYLKFKLLRVKHIKFPVFFFLSNWQKRTSLFKTRTHKFIIHILGRVYSILCTLIHSKAFCPLKKQWQNT